MTIQQAAKSGRRIKLPWWVNFYEPNDALKELESMNCILRDDWQVEEPTYQFGETEVKNALRSILFSHNKSINIDTVFHDLIRGDYK